MDRVARPHVVVHNNIRQKLGPVFTLPPDSLGRSAAWQIRTTCAWKSGQWQYCPTRGSIQIEVAVVHHQVRQHDLPRTRNGVGIREVHLVQERLDAAPVMFIPPTPFILTLYQGTVQDAFEEARWSSIKGQRRHSNQSYPESRAPSLTPTKSRYAASTSAESGATCTPSSLSCSSTSLLLTASALGLVQVDTGEQPPVLLGHEIELTHDGHCATRLHRVPLGDARHDRRAVTPPLR